MRGVDVRQWREKAGLSRAQLADMLGMSIHGVIKWEQGTRAPARDSRLLELALKGLEKELAEQPSDD